MRKGLADLHRRAQVSQQSNQSYLDALAAVDDDTSLHLLLDQVSRPITYHGRRLRALRIGDLDGRTLLGAVARGEFASAFAIATSATCSSLAPPRPPPHARSLSARVSRQLRLLRAHRIIRKVAKSHRSRLTDRGRLLAAALFALRPSTLAKLIGTLAA